MFIDEAKIYVKGGNGGDGAVAFRREKFIPAGGPAGGDGGNGGSVIIEVDTGLRTLMDFRYKGSYKAATGENGRGKNQFGKAAEDLILKVPPGTLIRDQETGEALADLTEDNSRVVIARGGRGGKGNTKFTTSTRQAPTFSQGGTKGQEREIILELKLIADIGLVGFPNVGKSTLLSIVSDAKPKIANYHFTTLTPNLGVVKVDEGNSFVIADIPGLIEGAHEGIGLGHEFLRHIERTRAIVHLIDASGQEGRDPVEDFYKINEELEKYSEKLADKPQIVVANKMDLPGSKEGYERLKEEVEAKGYEILSISAATVTGIKELKYAISEKLEEIGEPEPLEKIDEGKLYEYDKKDDEILVRKQGNLYYVEGSSIERIINSVNFDDYESVRYFQEAIRKLGVVEELKSLGINEEDSVDICGYEFEFFE